MIMNISLVHLVGFCLYLTCMMHGNKNLKFIQFFDKYSFGQAHYNLPDDDH